MASLYFDELRHLADRLRTATARAGAAVDAAAATRLVAATADGCFDNADGASAGSVDIAVAESVLRTEHRRIEQLYWALEVFLASARRHDQAFTDGTTCAGE